MPRPTPIRVIVETVSSARDVNGNCYHFATFYTPKKGRQQSVRMHVHGESNARSIAYRLAGRDHEGVLSFASTIAKRDWKIRATCIGMSEGSDAANCALAKLFGTRIDTPNKEET